MSDNASHEVIFIEANILYNAMDKLSKVMSEMTDSHKNCPKPYKPPYEPYMTGLKWGWGRENSKTPLVMGSIVNSLIQVIIKVIKGHLTVEATNFKTIPWNMKGLTRAPPNMSLLFLQVCEVR